MSTIEQEMVLAHFIVSGGVERSRRFYADVLGGKTVICGEAADEVTYVAPATQDRQGEAHPPHPQQQVGVGRRGS